MIVSVPSQDLVLPYIFYIGGIVAYPHIYFLFLKYVTTFALFSVEEYKKDSHYSIIDFIICFYILKTTKQTSRRIIEF